MDSRFFRRPRRLPVADRTVRWGSSLMLDPSSAHTHTRMHFLLCVCFVAHSTACRVLLLFVLVCSASVCSVCLLLSVLLLCLFAFVLLCVPLPLVFFVVLSLLCSCSVMCLSLCLLLSLCLFSVCCFLSVRAVCFSVCCAVCSLSLHVRSSYWFRDQDGSEADDEQDEQDTKPAEVSCAALEAHSVSLEGVCSCAL